MRRMRVFLLLNVMVALSGGQAMSSGSPFDDSRNVVEFNLEQAHESSRIGDVESPANRVETSYQGGSESFASQPFTPLNEGQPQQSQQPQQDNPWISNPDTTGEAAGTMMCNCPSR